MGDNYFITFEGIDGAGKDTQLTYLMDGIRDDNTDIFGNKYSNIWITREPTKITESGREISELLKGDSLSKELATQLFVGDRIEHSGIIRSILPHSHILCSRYDLSTLTYQMSQGMEFEELYRLHDYTGRHGALIPDLTIVIDVTVDTALKRIGKRKSDKEYFEKKDLLQKTLDNTLYCVKRLQELDNRKILVIDGNPDDPEIVKENMFRGIQQYLS